MTKGFFITGTDTEVGKTLVSAALILKLRAQKIRVSGFKPVVAGTYLNATGETCNEDVETLLLTSDTQTIKASLCPYILNAAVAPHLAAAQQDLLIDMNILMESFQSIQSKTDYIVVEGAGGFIVPLNDQHNLSDFAKAIQLPIILVVGMKLGCINHALLTCEAIKSRNLKIAGWVANSLSEEMPLLQENLETLKNRISAPFLGLIPTLPAKLQKKPNNPYSLEALTFAAQHIQLP